VRLFFRVGSLVSVPWVLGLVQRVAKRCVVVGGSDVFSAFRLFGIASPSIPTKNSIPARLLGAASFSGRLARP
jgi:hypothetical protein